MHQIAYHAEAAAALTITSQGSKHVATAESRSAELHIPHRWTTEAA